MNDEPNENSLTCAREDHDTFSEPAAANSKDRSADQKTNNTDPQP